MDKKSVYNEWFSRWHKDKQLFSFKWECFANVLTRVNNALLPDLFFMNHTI